MKNSKNILSLLSLITLFSTLSSCKNNVNNNVSSTSSVISTISSTSGSTSSEVVDTPLFKYVINTNNEATITAILDDSVTVLVIPDEIEGKKVTSIDLSEESYSKNVKSIKFGQYINNISFYNVDFDNLVKLEVDENSPYFIVKDNCIFSKELVRGYKVLYLGCNSSIIPDENVAGYENVALYTGAFYSTKLESIHISKNITDLGSPVFDCSKLAKITVAADNENFTDAGLNVVLGKNENNKSILYVTNKDAFVPNDSSICTEIARYVFSKLTIESITIPDNINEIDFNFYNCPNLKTIKLSSALQKIFFNSDTFKKCPQLSNIDTSNNTNYYFENNILYEPESPSSKTKFVVLSYIGRESTVTLDEKFVQIGTYAFAKNTTLKTVALPAKLSLIVDYAFQDSAIENINLENVSALKTGSFAGCKNLKTVELCSKLTTLNDGVLNGAVIEKLVINQAMQSLINLRNQPGDSTIDSYSIGNSTFFTNCYIKDIELKGEGNTYVFKNNQLLSVSNSRLLFIIGDDNNITIESTVNFIVNLKLYSTVDTTYNFPREVLSFGGCKNIKVGKTFTLPETVTMLCDKAFIATEFEEINLNNSLQLIGDRAFMASKVKKLIFPETVTKVGNYLLWNSMCEELEIKNGKTLAFTTTYSLNATNVKVLKYHGTKEDLKTAFTTKKSFENNFPSIQTIYLKNESGEFVSVAPSELTW